MVISALAAQQIACDDRAQGQSGHRRVDRVIARIAVEDVLERGLVVLAVRLMVGEDGVVAGAAEDRVPALSDAFVRGDAGRGCQ